MAPPPPEVIILFPLNEKTPTSPKEPTDFPLTKLPKDSAASSTTGIHHFLQIATISSIQPESQMYASEDMQKFSFGFNIIAFPIFTSVLLDKNSNNEIGDKPIVSTSTSIKTG